MSYKYNWRLAKKIKDGGIKQTWMAGKLNVHRSMITLWIYGYRKLSNDRKFHIAKLLNCHVSEIFTGEEIPQTYDTWEATEE